ncbi:MAG: hypothetical protein ACFFD7_03015 [Candidatus Thorarchaeota archaeon]
MSDKGNNNKRVDDKKDNLQYGTSTIVCFACGAQIEKKTTTCPYCKTEIM